MNPSPFILSQGNSPIIISMPHVGTEFPKDIQPQFHPDIVAHPEDTDWFIDKLYDFAVDLDITVIKARYSRYVIDLNRDPKDKPLYNDGRHLTGLLPTSTFTRKAIYREEEPSAAEVEHRLTHYYYPYHHALRTKLAELRSRFPHVLLFDAHSIKRFVPTIHPEKFPSLILGNQDKTTAHAALIECALDSLRQDNLYDVSDNFPFKGGYITRHFGQPEQGTHTLQLEMAQDLYMDEVRTQYDASKAQSLKLLLQSMFHHLHSVLRDLA